MVKKDLNSPHQAPLFFARSKEIRGSRQIRAK
jgi:hypothetical protein